MTIKKTIFWAHLGAGVVASLVVAMMSVTGVLLTYERQIREWSDRELYDIDVSLAGRLTVDELLVAVSRRDAEFGPWTIRLHARPDMPPVASRGRRGQVYLDPHSGDILGPGNERVRAFLGTMRGWHRWFDLTGDSRASGRAVTGATNLLFLFLIVSGIYLWLPPVWHWLIVRTRLFFNDRAKTRKAKDYNWHHVFGFWCFLPLFLIVLAATPISYPWARSLVYMITGDAQPARGGNGASREVLADSARPLPLQVHADAAVTAADAWQRLDVRLPDDGDTRIEVVVDWGTGGEPHKKTTVSFDRLSGEPVSSATFADRTMASKVLSYFRWVHTGEAHGLAGQTVAGIVSALSVVMVWTGLALSWRRLIQPVFRRRRLARGDQ
jgi:uncharacterized iron-regulated membrane protein